MIGVLRSSLGLHLLRQPPPSWYVWKPAFAYQLATPQCLHQMEVLGICVVCISYWFSFWLSSIEGLLFNLLQLRTLIIHSIQLNPPPPIWLSPTLVRALKSSSRAVPMSTPLFFNMSANCGRMMEKITKGSGVCAYVSQMLLTCIQILHFLKERKYMWSKIVSCGTMKFEI
jgi:hypothetical protein